VNHANPDLVELIRSKIAREGPVTFAWFMDQALYHPEHGYYASGQVKLGRRGDYFTNVSVGPMFGRLLAFQLAEMWEELGRPGNFTIIEQGAHDGQLAGDLLRTASHFFPDFFESSRYLIIEPSPALRKAQQTGLSEFNRRVDWSDSLEAIEPFIGVHFSNELLDAMPVRLVRRTHKTTGTPWLEKLVDWSGNQFEFVATPIGDSELNAQLKPFADVTDEIELEIHLAALDWVTAISRKLERGFVLTIDYGFATSDLVSLQHRTGTLRYRVQHRLIDSPFDFIGHCDITAHVHWTAIARRAVENGLTIVGFTDQHHFLTGILAKYPQALQANDPNGRRQLQTLLHPEMMGRSFQVLLFTRGTAADPKLGGFQFARDPLAQRGLSESYSV
jgi:SAM-dependent MidA family methyltransferase